MSKDKDLEFVEWVDDGDDVDDTELEVMDPRRIYQSHLFDDWVEEDENEF